MKVMALLSYGLFVYNFFAPTFAVPCETARPGQVATLVETIAGQEGLDPGLALAVAGVESNLGRSQSSEVGALGIMQLMPETAAALGVADRCDPEANIRAGIRYLKQLYQEFDDPLLMLAAYNAGPGRVYEKGGIPEFNETANYVVRVMNRWKLNARISDGKQRNIRLGEGVEHVAASPDTNPWRDAHVWSAEQEPKQEALQTRLHMTP